MGAGFRHRVGQASLKGAALVVSCLLLLTGCGATEEDARVRATETLDAGARVVADDLQAILQECEAAVRGVEGALSEAGVDRARRFEALEVLRDRHGVDGILWQAPGEDDLWAGRPIEPRDLPAPRPWQASFQSGRVHYHDGPFLRALIVGPTTVGTGQAYATYVLDEGRPEDLDVPAFEERWLEPLELLRVRLVPPDAVPPGTGAPCCARSVPIPDVSGHPVLVALLEVHDLPALQQRDEADHAAAGGALLLLLLIVLTIVVLRRVITRIPDAPARWGVTAVVVLAFRGALRLLDLPGRFPELGAAFSPSEFAVETPLGWLASPGGFALTAIAYLLTTLCLAHAIRHLRLPHTPVVRVVRIFVALVCTALAVGMWLLTIQVAVVGGQTPFFQARTFVPSAPAGLMLLGIVAVTATTYVIAHICMRRALDALEPQRLLLGRVLLALGGLVATGLVTGAAGRDHPTIFLIPVLAAFAVKRIESPIGIALPGRVLVLSVLATALAFPVLWDRVGARGNDTLAATLDDLLDGEELTQAGVEAALLDAEQDDYLREALMLARGGARPEGLALHLWLQSGSQWQRRPGVVTVLDDRGRELESFSLTTLPRHMLPAAQPPPQPGRRHQVFVARGDGTRLRSVVGRLRLADEAGEDLGQVVITVPDEMDLRLKGLGSLTADRGPRGPVSLATGARLQFAKLRTGVVIGASDPTIPRVRGSFGPSAIAGLGPRNTTLEWADDVEEGYARWTEVRGAVFAVRQARASFDDALLALSRLIVVGVGLGILAAIGCLVFTVRGLKMRVHHKILVSYFIISVIPLVLLGLASAREVQQRHDARLNERLATDLARARSELENHGAGVFDSADTQQLEMWAPERRHDILLYRYGELQAGSRMGLLDAELVSPRLPADAYRATVLEKREFVARDDTYAGRRVWFGYAPVLDGDGDTRATVAVPLRYEAGRIEQQVTVTGSVLLAAYMLTIVLVLVGGLYAARRLTRPLDLLVEGTTRVADGDLDVELPGEGTDELGQLVVAFNGMTAALREATAMAARAERESAWRSMASQAAHEIKNPLTPMRLMLQQMQADIDRDPSRAPDVIAQTAPKVLRQIEGLNRIARNFAQFARLPQRRTTRLDAGELVREVTAMHEGARENGVDVRCEIEADLPPVYWDEEELRRVLLNLVLNAVESIEGEGEVLLRAEQERRDGRAGVRVTIRDTGVGIPQDDRAKLFEPQFSTKTRGTGLGLAIVDGILKDMRGDIQLDSQPGEGTTVTVWWPAGDQGA